MAKAKHPPKAVRAATRKVMQDRAKSTSPPSKGFLSSVQAELDKAGGVGKVLPYAILAYLVSKVL